MEISFGLRGPSPQAFYLLWGGLGLLPGAWGAPKRGIPTGSKVFLALPDACGLCPCDRAHLKKRLCSIFVRWWDASINVRVPRSFLGCLWPFFSSCWVAFGRPSYLWAVLPGVPRQWRFPPASGGPSPQAFTSFVGVGFIAWRPQKGECRRGRWYFWSCRTRVGFGPATRPSLKTALWPYSCVCGTHQ